MTDSVPRDRASSPVPPGRKLLDQVRDAIRARHYSRRIEASYVHWIRRFILFHRRAHPSTMGAREIEAFLSSLASEKHVSASTQNQALSSLLFLYRHVHLQCGFSSVRGSTAAVRSRAARG